MTSRKLAGEFEPEPDPLDVSKEGVTVVGPVRKLLAEPTNVGGCVPKERADDCAAVAGNAIPLRRSITIRANVEKEVFDDIIFSCPSGKKPIKPL